MSMYDAVFDVATETVVDSVFHYHMNALVTLYSNQVSTGTSKR